ncbi:hypothetical protein PV08_09656 [Exophiala spinifera]|uniref:Heterokaryon incompatibility domain-containing protein n=1 Tax=Exophiala spinifera TaxID=91928 RepID=A0A0D2BMI6_9EURO|nr:uncharacterized protein PV08_09656 [Exophiala spinifera]KIW12379.1 hypothetical protein PV08_09656 [Exophiala spinifera]
MYRLRETSSVSALGVIANPANIFKDPSFQVSIPYRKPQQTGETLVGGPYGSKACTKDDKGKVCLRCWRWSLTGVRDTRKLVEGSGGHQNSLLGKHWGYPAEMLDADCPMCRLFGMHSEDFQSINGPMQGRRYDLRELTFTVKLPQSRSSGHLATTAKFWYLVPSSAPRSNFAQLAGSGSCIGLADGRDGSAASPSDHLMPVLIDPNTINYNTIETWLALCDRNHRGTCDFLPTETVPHLRLIDCLALPPKLVDAMPRRKYAALSYVWGRGGVKEQLEGDTVVWRLLPQTIRDAMTVTRKLGLRYLWVDRYCIPPPLLQEQISKMDVIYSGAELVIVAAAGGDIEYGLPGVGARKRTQQPYATVGKDVFASTLTDFDSMMHTCSWWKRAWCFQEALLSRRRLIFTDEKVYFLCRNMLCVETLSIPFEDPSHRPRTRMDSSTGFFDWLVTGGSSRENPDQIRAILSAYSGKGMSFESDGLNAIAGVLRAFARVDKRGLEFRSYGGLAITGPPTTNSFVSALLWAHWIPRGRRPGGFPSWSWVGWTGSFRASSISREVDHEMEALLLEGDGTTTVSWEGFVARSRPDDGIFPLSLYIRLHALTCMVQVCYRPSAGKDQRYVVPVQRLPGGKVRYATVSLGYACSDTGGLDDDDLHVALVQRPQKCVLLVPHDDARKLSGIALLVRKVGDEHYERTGMFQFEYFGNVYDEMGNYDSFLLSTDERAAVEGFDFQREWICLG